jgi:uncharacterized protein YjbI with pentapeptide repeats
MEELPGKNILNLSPYNFYENFDSHDNYGYVFNYHLLVANRELAEYYMNKWATKDETLSRISIILLSDNKIVSELSQIDECQLLIGSDKITKIENKFTIQNNIQHEIHYKFDLRGIRISGAKISSTFHAFNNSRLDYSLIEKSVFSGGDNILKCFMGFNDVSLKHVKFSECHFNNMKFGSGEYAFVVFYNCTFNNVSFDGFGANYSNIFFQIWEFNNVNFSSVDISTFCFFGYCKFNGIQIDTLANYEKIMGDKIIKWTLQKDLQTFDFRKKIKGFKGNGSYIYYREDEKYPGDLQRRYTSNIYQGLTAFYNATNSLAETSGEYDLYWVLSYNFSYCRDKIYQNRNSIPKKVKIYINKNYFGYGFKYEKSLSLIALLIGIGSILYLFCGISFNGSVIKRSFTFNPHELKSTLVDWFKCLYFSLKSTSSIGLGDFVPTSITSLLISIIQGCIGFITFTVFIVILSRRYFK